MPSLRWQGVYTESNRPKVVNRTWNFSRRRLLRFSPGGGCREVRRDMKVATSEARDQAARQTWQITEPAAILVQLNLRNRRRIGRARVVRDPPAGSEL